MKAKNFKSKEELIKNAAVLVIETLSEALGRSEVAHFAVSGGSTPLALFQYLEEHCLDSLNWNNIHFWWVDERFVAHNDTENNYKNAMEAGLDNIPAVFHRISTEGCSISEAVQHYENEMNKVFGGDNFNLIILGAGTDGHTASLFKSDMSRIKNTETVIQTINPHNQQQRISLNFNRLLKSEKSLLLLSGENKKEVYANLEVDNEVPINWMMQNSKNSIIFTDFN